MSTHAATHPVKPSTGLARKLVTPDIVRQALVAGAPVSVSLIAPRPRFPSGPWCKAGDTVLFSRYAGKRFKIEGVEFRMLADDEITATIPDGAKVGGL